ncbi:MAG: N-formylglutamate amidohydrolase [Bdellovibrionaceae bacterium]|nr:N-formylglutamate amidohydrolase [Bdellovibrionales bacterium]MCB9254804.1 N-formylglutamate amidohydrolase [Pseudobdellovibrionaceae bacterium]
MPNQDPYYVVPPKGAAVPIVLSSPHSGTEIPSTIAATMRPALVEVPEDTDWFVHRLYDFVSELGVTLIHARYSRYVIDLNRDPTNQPLYSDLRKETALVPTQTFSGAPLYRDGAPSTKERERRLQAYYLPYHEKLGGLLREMRQQHPHVLLFDAHSIRRTVTTISETPFADLILGDQNGKTAHPTLTESALASLKTSSYQVSHNVPFKGGYITRHFGKPSTGIHGLQLEMSQDVYMDPDRLTLDTEKATKVRHALRNLIQHLLGTLQSIEEPT